MINLFDETQIQELLKQRKEKYENNLKNTYIFTPDNVLFWIRSDEALFTLDVTNENLYTCKINGVEEKYETKYLFEPSGLSEDGYYHLGHISETPKLLNEIFSNPEILLFSLIDTYGTEELWQELKSRNLLSLN